MSTGKAPRTSARTILQAPIHGPSTTIGEAGSRRLSAAWMDTPADSAVPADGPREPKAVEVGAAWAPVGSVVAASAAVVVVSAVAVFVADVSGICCEGTRKP